jgi:FkbM family methyltransferase
MTMHTIIKEIVELVESNKRKPDFLDFMFGKHKYDALQDAEVVLFGAGGLGIELCSTLRNHGIKPICFCDNDDSKNDKKCCNLPIITFHDLKSEYKNSIIVIASHKYLSSITDQLLDNGFSSENILCQKSDPVTPIVFMYSMIGTQCLFAGYKKECGDRSLLDIYFENEKSITDAYDIFTDEHSKGLYIAKLALMASNQNFELFKNFIQKYSQPVLEYGFGNYEGTPEDYYYFNNDVLNISQSEVYVDVGAYDGDTVHTFVETCKKNRVDYTKIHAFEPDPQCYKALIENTAGYHDVICNQAGVWSQSQIMKFSTSENGIHDQAGKIDQYGNIEIKVFSLDDYFRGEKVTFVKMDPGGNIIPEAIQGAANTIAQYRPKLALGSYHAAKSLFEIPLLVHQICPDYKLYLRHNTYHLCDTDLLATL